MKKLLLSMKSLLIAAGLLMGAGVSWGATTTLLEFGTNDVAWTTEGLATWTAGGTPTIIENSYVHISGGNGSYETSKNISPTANAVINVTAVWRGRSDTGRTYAQGNGSYFRFGNIVVAQNDQDQKHGYVFNGLTSISSVTTFSVGSYRGDNTTGTWLLIDAEINTATNTLTSFTIKSEDGATTYVTKSDIPLSSTDYTTVAFGYKKTGSVSTSNFEDLKSIKITQNTQDVVVRGYTIKFQDASGNTLKDDITSRTGVVGTVIPVTDSDKADFYTGEGDGRKKWTYASDNSAEEANKIAEDGSTVVIVKFSEVAKYSYSATTKAGETELPYSYAGSQFKDETVKIPYPRYQLQSGTLYTKAATSNEYNYSFTLDSDNQEETITGYSDSEIKDVVFYTEGEDITGATKHTSTGAISSRSSASAVGISDGALTIMNGLPVGKYKIFAAFYKNSSANVSTSFTIGSTVVNVSTNTTLTNLQEATSEEFVVSNTSDVVWAGTGLLDYVYIQKTGDAISGYTIKFQDASGNTLKDDITSRTGIEGTVISVTDSDKADFYTGEGDSRKKWTYASDDSAEESNKIAEDGSTVVIVKFNEVDKYSYSATTKAGEIELPYSYAGSQFKGETVKIPYPRYQLQSGTLYTKGATSNEYNYSFTLNSDNQEETITGYSDSEIENVIFYTEGEDITGATKHTSTGAISTRSSASAVGTSDGALTIMNGLPAGKYQIVVAFYKNNSANVSTSFTIGSSVVNVSTNTSNTNLQEATSEEFVVSNTSDVVWAGTGLLDYVYIQKTGDVTVPVSGLADGEYVYTPQGRFQITGDIIARSNFNDFSGWEVITATDGKTVADNFVIDTENGPAAGVNCVVSKDATAGEGMCFKFTPTDADATYVVSYKMKGAQAVTTRVKTVAVSTNLVKVEGNSDGVYGGTNDVLLCNTAEELSDEWQTFNYAIVGDGVPRTYFISFSGMSDNIYIADLQIAEAYQVADLRARDAAIERVNVYKNAYAWSEEDLNDFGINDAVEMLKAIGDQSSQRALDEVLIVAYETLNDFLNYEDVDDYHSNMDDYLAGGDERNYLSNTFGVAGDSEASSYGVWNCIPSGRGHWAANAYPDMGHYQNGTTWNNGAPTTAQGVTTQMELTPGSYVFAIKSAAALREPLEQTWHTDDGMKPAYGIAYIAKVNGETVDIIASSEQKDLEPVKMTPFYVTANITEAGKYEFGMLAYCKEAYQSLNLGSVTYVGDASIMGKNYEKYTKKQLMYEADVREMIAMGRDQLTLAAANLANAEKIWGKDELQACVNTVAPKIAAYETLTQDYIIATYAAYYEKTISNDNGIMFYSVYVEAVKDIIAANRRFDAVNSVVPVTITSAGWATLYTPYAIDFSTVEGLEAYTATVSENTVTLTKVNNVPAGTGVVLKGEAKDYNIPVTSNSETEKGSLEGSATEATAYDAFSGYKLYMLKKVGDNVQFVPMTSGSLAKGKAYLKIAQDNAGSGEAKALSVVFVNEPTGIKSVNSDETKVNGIYDLQGRRVSQPTKGLYIVNGKKVVIK